ncbi:hypothetical protein Hanom_Chr11g00999461 [Helianthus anomalus]
MDIKGLKVLETQYSLIFCYLVQSILYCSDLTVLVRSCKILGIWVFFQVWVNKSFLHVLSLFLVVILQICCCLHGTRAILLLISFFRFVFFLSLELFLVCGLGFLLLETSWIIAWIVVRIGAVTLDLGFGVRLNIIFAILRCGEDLCWPL